MGKFLLAEANDGLVLGLGLAILVVAIAIGIVAFISYIVKCILIIKYKKYNKVENTEGYTAKDAARHFLDACNMPDVQVETCGFWRMLVYGNSYSGRKKTIFLRKNIAEKKTITAVGVALQKVSLAIQDRDNNKDFKFVDKMRRISILAPYLFIPLGLLGVILDMVLFKNLGICASVLTGIGVVYFILAFVLTMLTIPVEKRANRQALELMEKTQFLQADERDNIQDLFKMYETEYVIDFILGILYIIYYTLRIILQIVVAKK